MEPVHNYVLQHVLSGIEVKSHVDMPQLLNQQRPVYYEFLQTAENVVNLLIHS